MSKIPVNEFFDINKLPLEKGILVFPISMSRISTSQNAKSCWEHLRIFSPDKIIKPLVGLNIIYSDFLYLYSDEKASELKSKFSQLVINHKNEFNKIINKNKFYIQQAFSFTTWNQLYLECKEFTSYFGDLKQIYRKDKKFQKYIQDDLKSAKKQKLDENQLNFFLEEILMSYLITKGKVRLQNEFVRDQQKWVLYCYPGKPLKSQIYLFQQNFFKLNNPTNDYQAAFYDLEEKKLYDFNRVDLETIDL